MAVIDYVAQLYRGAAPAVATTVYTVPASTKTVVQSVRICNTDTATRTLTLLLDGQELVKDLPISPKYTLVLDDLGDVLTTGKTIQIVASVAAVVKVHISGIEAGI